MSKKRKYRRKAKAAFTKRQQSVGKTSASSSRRLPRKGLGTAGIASYQELIDRIQPYELRWPQSMKTFEAMKNDDAVSTVLNLSYALISKAFSNYTIDFKESSTKSRKAAEFLDWCLQSLDGQTFNQVIRNIATFKEKGFAVAEKVYTEINTGSEFVGFFKVSQLANRPQASLDETTPFEIDKGGRRIKALRQNVQYFRNDLRSGSFIETTDIHATGYATVRRSKFILFGDNATDSTPFGQPIFRSCYKAWKEKVLLEDLGINGASKDLAGILEIAMPGEMLETASNDPESPEAQMVEDFCRAAANVHAGEEAYFLRPSDVQDAPGGHAEYSTKLLGIDGSGRQFDTSEMIQQRRKAIFDVFGAGHTLTGEGSVSYNSAEVKSVIHEHYIQKDITVMEEGFNCDLVPELLNVMNNFNLTQEEMPKIKAGAIDKLSIEEVSKSVQRTISVNGLVKTKRNIIHYHKSLGYPTQHMEDMTEAELIKMMSIGEEGTSRSGQSNGTSGTGNSQDSTGGDNNLENKSLSGLRVDSVGVYTRKGGSKTYIPLKDIPADIKECLTFTD